jgi:hypothetical protein
VAMAGAGPTAINEQDPRHQRTADHALTYPTTLLSYRGCAPSYRVPFNPGCACQHPPNSGTVSKIMVCKRYKTYIAKSRQHSICQVQLVIKYRAMLPSPAQESTQRCLAESSSWQNLPMPSFAAGLTHYGPVFCESGHHGSCPWRRCPSHVGSDPSGGMCAAAGSRA